MFNARSIPADHKDLVHDVSYDFYGKRFATCSSDQVVKIWDKDSDDQWYCSSSFKAHSGSVWRVTWAHPEFGQIIATCSFDRTVGIWEEKVSSPSSSPSRPQQQGSTSTIQETSHPQSTWLKRALLVDSRSSITDVQFAPKHLGLLLATCSSDGTVRIYEAPDIMNLSQWNPQNDLNCRMSCSCLSWNPSPFHAPMIAVGSDEPAGDPSSAISSLFAARGGAGNGSSSSSPAGRVLVFESSENARKWILVDVVRICEPVHDLAFACSVGRDYHLLAVASSDVKIFSLKDVPSSSQQHSLNESATPSSHLISQSYPDSASPTPKYEIQQIAKFDDHASRVWRLSWNLTGTILASSGEDGRVRLWKSNYLDSWKSIGVIKMDGSGGISGSTRPAQCLGQRSAGSRS